MASLSFSDKSNSSRPSARHISLQWCELKNRAMPFVPRLPSPYCSPTTTHSIFQWSAYYLKGSARPKETVWPFIVTWQPSTWRDEFFRTCTKSRKYNILSHGRFGCYGGYPGAKTRQPADWAITQNKPSHCHCVSYHVGQSRAQSGGERNHDVFRNRIRNP